LRLNVLVKDYLPQEAREQVNEVVADAPCRVCEIKTTRQAPADGTMAARQMTLSDFRQRTPLEIAKDYMARKLGEPMTERQQAMFNEVYDEIIEENRQ